MNFSSQNDLEVVQEGSIVRVEEVKLPSLKDQVISAMIPSTLADGPAGIQLIEQLPVNSNPDEIAEEQKL